MIHCNDWQTALAPAYLAYGAERPARSLVTVHNLAFQGLFDHAALFELGLPDAAWSMHGVEFYGHLSFLKAGLLASEPSQAATRESRPKRRWLSSQSRPSGPR